MEEDSLPGTVVVKLTLVDDDNELPTTLMFHIRDGDIHSKFAIRPTGEVYVANTLDRETLDNYQLTILVTDGKYVSTTTLHITVSDVNGISCIENIKKKTPFEFNNFLLLLDEKPYCLRHRYRRMLSEGTPVSTVILQIEASDADLNPKLRYYLTGHGAEHFSLDMDSGT